MSVLEGRAVSYELGTPVGLSTSLEARRANSSPAGVRATTSMLFSRQLHLHRKRFFIAVLATYWSESTLGQACRSVRLISCLGCDSRRYSPKRRRSRPGARPLVLRARYDHKFNKVINYPIPSWSWLFCRQLHLPRGNSSFEKLSLYWFLMRTLYWFLMQSRFTLMQAPRPCPAQAREIDFFIVNLLVRIHSIIEMILVDRPRAMGV